MTHPVHTVGHSTHPLEVFVGMLTTNGVDLVVDVRRLPGSRRYPHFDEEALSSSLPATGIGYRRVPELGGRRRTPAGQESVNGAWRNASFRAYADHMQTPEFAAAVDGLVALADEQHVALMCAEAVPWRCHRSLVGDALVVRGVPVVDILGPSSTRPHTLTSFARVDGERVWYPPED